MRPFSATRQKNINTQHLHRHGRIAENIAIYGHIIVGIGASHIYVFVIQEPQYKYIFIGILFAQYLFVEYVDLL